MALPRFADVTAPSPILNDPDPRVVTKGPVNQTPPVTFKDQADQQKYLLGLEKRNAKKVKIDPRVDPENPAAYSTVHGSASFVRELAAIRDGLKAGTIKREEVPVLVEQSVVREAALLTGGNFLNRAITDAANIAEYSIPSAIHIAKAGVNDVRNAASGDLSFQGTRDIAKDVGLSTYDAIRGKNWGTTPVSNAFAIGAVASIPFSVAARGAAVSSALKGANQPGVLGRAASVSKAVVGTPVPKKRYISVPGVDEPVQLVASNNPSFNAFQRNVLDRIAQNKIDRGGSATPALGNAVPGFIGSNFGAEARVGAAARAKRSMEDKLVQAEAAPLAKYGKTATAQILGSARGAIAVKGKRLSDSEQKAVDIALSGVSASVHIAQHQVDLQRAEALLLENVQKATAAKAVIDNGGSASDVAAAEKAYASAVSAMDVARQEITGNNTQLRLSVAASEHLANPSDVLQKAIEETRTVSNMGADVKKQYGLADEAAAARIGKRADYVESTAAGNEPMFDRAQRLRSYEYGRELIAKSRNAEVQALRDGRSRVRDAERQFRDAVKAEEKASRQYFSSATSRSPEERAVLKEIASVQREVAKAYSARYRNRPIVEVATRHEGLMNRQKQIVANMLEGFDAGVVSEGKLARAMDRERRLTEQYEKTASRLWEFRNGEKQGALLVKQQERLKQLLDQAEALTEKDVASKQFAMQRGFVERGKSGAALDAAKRDLTDSIARIRDNLAADLEIRSAEASLLSDQLTLYGQHLMDTKGAAYVPAQRLVKKPSVPLSRRPGRYGVSTEPKGKAFQAKQYTGKSQQSGRFRSDATNLVHDDYVHAVKWGSLYKALGAINDLPAIDPNSRYALFVRDTTKINEKLKELFDTSQTGYFSRRDDQALSKNVVEALREFIVDPASIPDKNNLPVGVKAVDARLGKFLTENAATYSYSGGLGRFADNLNNVFRAGLLYSSPKYALNLVQGLGANVVDQGVFAPRNWKNALTLGSKLSEPDVAKVLALMGESATRSLNTASVSGATGAFSTMMNRVAEFWNTVTDRVPRVAAFLHEAHNAGYRTPDDLSRLLNDPKLRDDLFQVQGVANKEAVEFGNLSPVEQNTIKRMVFFYPWLRGSTRYAARFPLEHPYQASVLQATVPAAEDTASDFWGGRVPRGFENFLPVGDGYGVNLSSVSTGLSPAEVVSGVSGLFKANSPDRFGLLGNLSPVASFARGALTGVSSSGTPLPGNGFGIGPVGSALKEQFDSLPPVRAVNTATAQPNTQTQPEKQYILPRGPEVAVGRYIGGGMYPVKPNRAAGAARGEIDYMKSLAPDQRVSYKAAKKDAAVRTQAKELFDRGVLDSPDVPALVLAAIDLNRKRDLYTIEYAKAKKTKTSRLSSLQKAEVTLDVLVSEGVIDNKYRSDALAYMRTLRDKDVPNVAGTIWARETNSSVLSQWDRFVEDAMAAR